MIGNVKKHFFKILGVRPSLHWPIVFCHYANTSHKYFLRPPQKRCIHFLSECSATSMTRPEIWTHSLKPHAILHPCVLDFLDYLENCGRGQAFSKKGWIQKHQKSGKIWQKPATLVLKQQNQKIKIAAMSPFWVMNWCSLHQNFQMK